VSLPGPPLRIAVLADFDGPHARRWLRVFVERGHDVHAISYYSPAEALAGVTLHVLRHRDAPAGAGAPDRPRPEGRGMPRESTAARWWRDRLPPSLLRFLHALRYRRAGLKRLVDAIAPDVFHAHYAVEHGFYGALAGFHPYVVSAWGSDLLVESHKTLGRLAARYALTRADLVTANDPSLAQRALELGVPAGHVQVVRLGIDDVFWATSPPYPLSVYREGGSEGEPEGASRELSVNVRPGDSRPPTIISDRALEPLYNVDVVLHAFARVRNVLPEARLMVAHDGSLRQQLQTLAATLRLGDAVSFVGRIGPAELAKALRASHVYVSVPDSDSFALSTLEAMASGAFPVLSRLPSVTGMIEDGVNGLLVSPGDVSSLAAALQRALSDVSLRQSAAVQNRALAEAAGNLERNMLAMERLYYRLAGRPVADGEAI
jgi:glycosyltransferase involved in cell wall biosynthesis